MDFDSVWIKKQSEVIDINEIRMRRGLEPIVKSFDKPKVIFPQFNNLLDLLVHLRDDNHVAEHPVLMHRLNTINKLDADSIDTLENHVRLLQSALDLHNTMLHGKAENEQTSFDELQDHSHEPIDETLTESKEE